MGQANPQRGLFYQLSLESFVPAEHPLRMIFLNLPHDPLDKASLPAMGGKASTPPGSKDDGLGDGEDRLELVEDLPLPCPACYGSGRQRTGFADRTQACEDCSGSGQLQ